VRNRPLFLAVAYFRPRRAWTGGGVDESPLRESIISILRSLDAHIFSFLLTVSRSRDVTRMHGYLNNREALSTATFFFFLSYLPLLLLCFPSQPRVVLYTIVECISHVWRRQAYIVSTDKARIALRVKSRRFLWALHCISLSKSRQVIEICIYDIKQKRCLRKCIQSTVSKGLVCPIWQTQETWCNLMETNTRIIMRPILTMSFIFSTW